MLAWSSCASVSDYAADRPAFLEWTRQLRRVQNSKDVLNWNTDKHYLKELAAMGLPTIPTNWLEPSQKLTKHQIHTRFPAFGEFVVKPAVSSGVRDIGRYTTVDIHQRQAAMRQVQGLLGEGRSVMLQRYVEEIDLHGEISLVFSMAWSPTPLRSARPCTPPPSPTPRCTRPC